jgi:ribosomal protein S18 acetylase RimI-like enzyme
LIELRTLEELNAGSLGLITGYVSEEKYSVQWEDSEVSTTFTLGKTALKPLYVKRYDPPDGELLERYAKAVRSGLSIGAFDGTEQIGLAIAEAEEWNLSLWVWEFHVAEARRGQGVGRLMMEELILRAMNTGLRTIVCETQTTNVPAMDFYRSLGFRVEGIDLSYYGNTDWPDGEVAVFMKRRLGTLRKDE